ncbi:MAG: hypothetical protein ACFN4F_01765 [Porphyromonas endodontalis]|uniref:hypothetical protein n=1 Tax=Porphyromonas endodontalis TaxID=28124 RepID=UPI00361997C1
MQTTNNKTTATQRLSVRPLGETAIPHNKFSSLCSLQNRFRTEAKEKSSLFGRIWYYLVFFDSVPQPKPTKDHHSDESLPVTDLSPSKE